MSILPAPHTLFDIWDSEFLVKLPFLRNVLTEKNNHIRSQVKRLTDLTGPIPLKLRHVKSNVFKDMMFNWMYEPLPDQAAFLEELEDEFVGAMMWYDSTGHKDLLLNELKDVIGLHATEQRQGLTHMSYTDLNEQIENYGRYHFYTAIAEHSVPIALLREMDAQYRYERRLDSPYIVVDDPKIGLMLKLRN